MPITEQTFIKLETRTFVVLLIGIISIVSSFWVGYGNVMLKLDRIEYHAQAQQTLILDLEARIVKLEDK